MSLLGESLRIKQCAYNKAKRNNSFDFHGSVLFMLPATNVINYSQLLLTSLLNYIFVNRNNYYG